MKWEECPRLLEAQGPNLLEEGADSANLAPILASLNLKDSRFFFCPVPKRLI